MTLLYDIGATYRAIADCDTCPAECDAGRVLDPVTLAATPCDTCHGGDGVDVAPYLDRLQGEIRDRALNIAKVVAEIETEADALHGAASRLRLKEERRRRRVESLKQWLMLELEAGGLQRVRDPFVHVYTQRSNPSVRVIDDGAVPDEFKRCDLQLAPDEVPEHLTERVRATTIQKSEILRYVKETGEVPAGVEFVNNARHVRILR